jgi:uncharacterized membrane protein
MTNRHNAPRDTDAPGNTVKAPEDWATGEEPMTGAQRSYLKTLCEEANQPLDETLTKAQAAQRISELQQQTGRGIEPHRRRSPRDVEAPGNMVKDPDDWTTGDEPMTRAQRSYLKTLCTEANEPGDETLTKAQASKRIDELQQQTGRGGALQEHPC